MFTKPIAFAALALMLAGCTQTTTTTTTEITEDSIPAAPETPTPVEFTAIYNVPLTKVTAEDYPADLIRPEFVEKNNLGILKPTMEKMLNDAILGMVKAYPESGTDPENNPKTYFSRQVKAFAAKGRKIDVASLSKNLSVENKCMDMGSYSNLSPEFLIIVWTDPKEESPEIRFAKIALGDVISYSAKVDGKGIGLDEIIVNGDFEKYVASIHGPTETVMLSDIKDAAALQQKINTGDIH